MDTMHALEDIINQKRNELAFWEKKTKRGKREEKIFAMKRCNFLAENIRDLQDILSQEKEK